MFWVLSGEHTNPMDIKTLLDKTKKVDGPFWSVKEANQFALNIMQKNIDNYYHRAHVLNNEPKWYMTIFYISIYKGEVVARVDSVDKLIKATMDYTSKLPHAPYPCMVTNDMQASTEYPHINYEEDETNNSKYGFNGSENKY